MPLFLQLALKCILLTSSPSRTLALVFKACASGMRLAKASLLRPAARTNAFAARFAAAPWQGKCFCCLPQPKAGSPFLKEV
jgi:hypothetical protein